MPTYAAQQIAGKGITMQAALNLGKQPIGTPLADIIVALQLASGVQSPMMQPTGSAVSAANTAVKNAETDATATPYGEYKKYVPYVFGAVVLGAIIYLISKN